MGKFNIDCRVVFLGVKLIGKLPKRGSDSVCGLTVLNNKLYVLHYADQDQIDVFGFPADQDICCPKDFVLFGTLTLPAKKDDIRDMTSCVVNNCIYVSNKGGRCIHKIAADEHIHVVCAPWCIDEHPNGLSVIKANCNILVTCRDDLYLIEVDPQGNTVQKIKLPESFISPLHAFQLDDGAYLISHGDMRSPEHRVCKLLRNGKVNESYGGQKGSDQGQLNEPCHMALSHTGGYVFVADFNNGRVVMLDSSLQFLRDVVKSIQKVPYQRLCLDDQSQYLYIGDFNGDVTIFRLVWKP